MRKILATAGFLSLALTPVFALPQRDRDDRGDRDEHHGRHGRNEDEGHDNGKHKGWYKHGGRDDHRDWDYEHDRWRPGHPYPHGRYAEVKHAWQCRRFDVRARQVVLYDRSSWVIASYDVPRLTLQAPIQTLQKSSPRQKGFSPACHRVFK